MRRAFWLLALAPFACSNDDDGTEQIQLPITRIAVVPAAFLGDLVCAPNGGMETYQATVIDVTDGLEDSFVLPYSKVVSCQSALSFQFVQPGRRYIALVSGFDRSDIEAQNPGSPVVVDEEGKSVQPRWTTTCWGYDGEDPPSLGMGGADSGEDVDEMGGAGGAPALLGIESLNETSVVVRGCEALEDFEDPGPTGVSFDITTALSGQRCGPEAGEIDHFTITPLYASDGVGGAGGSAGESEPVSCGDPLVLEGLPAGEYLNFEGLTYEAGEDSPNYTTSCQALTVSGVIVDASCSLLRSL